MSKSEKILNRKSFFKAEMEKQLPKEQSDLIWEHSLTKLDGILSQYSDISGGVRIHTDNFIFPCAAVYLAAKEVIGEEKSYRVIEEASVKRSTDMGKKLAKLMKLPGMPALFIRIWDPMTRKIFGPDNGFMNIFYPKTKGLFRMDVLECPYCRYFGELGCPELTKIFCANDDRIYGNLPGTEFIRKNTLGRGGDKCDFLMKKRA